MGAGRLFGVVKFEQIAGGAFLRPKRNSGRVVAHCCLLFDGKNWPIVGHCCPLLPPKYSCGQQLESSVEEQWCRCAFGGLEGTWADLVIFRGACWRPRGRGKNCKN